MRNNFCFETTRYCIVLLILLKMHKTYIKTIKINIAAQENEGSVFVTFIQFIASIS